MQKHKGLHRYQLRDIGKRKDRDGNKKEYKVYHCNIPGCSHYKPPEQMFNVLSLCNRCDLPFIWDHAKNRNSVKPHCEECTRRKTDVVSTKPVDKTAISSLIGKILVNAGKV